tara:strand:- start:9183 stop:10082 length:900 start_codon:yes stop_codon:yes gene_type:complete
MITFLKKGLILKSRSVKWNKDYTWVPTAYKINNQQAIVFFARRDFNNESDTGYFIFDVVKEKVIKISKKPILRRGPLGSFDDSAAIASQILKIGNKYFLYYVGWTRGLKVPYFSSIGLAISNKIIGPYKKIHNAPIISQSKENPYFVATCFVKKDKNYRMYLTSNTEWKKKKKVSTPRYLIKSSISNDGIKWKHEDSQVLGFQNKNETAITRPWIIKYNNKDIMFFSLKKKQYKIETAIYKNKKWVRKKMFKFSNSGMKFKFDSESQEYSTILQFKDKFVMFYNGNNYGKDGIGYAVST